MAVSYPTLLPNPTYAGYGIEAEQTFVVSTFERGSIAKRRTSTTNPEGVKLSFEFSVEELGLFEAWYAHDVDYGMNLVELPIANGQGLDIKTVDFLEHPKKKMKDPLNFTVSVSVRLEDPSIYSAEAYAAAKLISPSVLDYYGGLLNTIVHHNLPEATNDV